MQVQKLTRKQKECLPPQLGWEEDVRQMHSHPRSFSVIVDLASVAME